MEALMSRMNTDPSIFGLLRTWKQSTSLFLLMLMSFIISGCSSNQTTPPPASETEKQAPAAPDILQLSPEAVRNLSLENLTVMARTVSGHLESIGQVRADENRVFHINSPVSGRILEDRVLIGDKVAQGQQLALVRNLEVAKIHAEFIHEYHQNQLDVKQSKIKLEVAKNNMEREKNLYKDGISSQKEYLQAEADAKMAQSELEGLEEHAIHIKSEAKAQLSIYGIRLWDEQLERIQTSSPVTAPRSGVVMKKEITVGDQVTPDQTLFEVVDLSRVWLDITLYPKDLELVRQDQRLSFQVDALPRHIFSGKIDYLQPAAESSSQTFIARGFLENPQGLLRPGMLGSVRIDTGNPESKAFLPENAIQSLGDENFVFRVLGPGRFQKQSVSLGEKTEVRTSQGLIKGYLVQSGVLPGEQVVGNGSFNLKAELLKNRFADTE